MNEQVQEIAVVEKVVNNVTMADGSVKNFGANGKLLSSQDVSTTGYTLNFYVVTGEVFTYTRDFGVEVKQFDAETAAFGAASKIKAAIAGSSAEDIGKIITAKIEEYSNELFVTRGSGTSVGSDSLTQIQTAYAMKQGWNPEDSSDISKVVAIFAAMSKEEKSELYNDAEIQFHLATIRYEAAKALLEASKQG